MKNVIWIKKQIEGLLDEMCELSREEGYDEGYKEAIKEFHIPG